MAPRKSERILNLTICLLSARRYLSREQIREAVEGYAGLSDTAFERTFERDKDELRRLGVPIETGSNSAYFDDETGYRISRTDFELPAVEFTADEAAVVAVAARVWQQANLADSTMSALAKLRAAGLEADTDRLKSLMPTVAATEAAFEPLWHAVAHAIRMSFTYRGGDVRTLEPWGIVSSKGKWYVVGLDTDKQAPRMFKLSRILDQPRSVSKPGAFAVPADVDIRRIAASLEPRPATMTAVVAIRGAGAPWLRRRGTPAPVALPAGLSGGFAAYAVPYSQESDVVAELATAGPDVVVLEPPELRRRVRTHLAQMVGLAGGGAP